MTATTRIERVPADTKLSAAIDAWKALREDGWDVTALVAPDKRTVVFLALKQGGST